MQAVWQVAVQIVCMFFSGPAVALARLNAVQPLGYQYVATTTRYGDTPATSCGGLNTRELVAGTEYHVVASAQAMQSVFRAPHTCTWECKSGSGAPIETCQYEGGCHGSDGHAKDGCSCRQIGDCMCGSAAPGAGHSSGVAPMGCFTCAKGQFIKKTPYSTAPEDDSDVVTKEIKVVVADICPYGSNAKWCPSFGKLNSCGKKNHLDFSDPPEGVNNNYFVFTPEACSSEITRRARSMQKHPCASGESANTTLLNV